MKYIYKLVSIMLALSVVFSVFSANVFTINAEDTAESAETTAIDYISEEANDNSSVYINAINIGESKGDATLLKCNGKYLLIDCGSEDAEEYITDYLKSINVTELDVLITHPHYDHMGGTHVMNEDSTHAECMIGLRTLADNFKINNFYIPHESLMNTNSDDKASLDLSEKIGFIYEDLYEIADEYKMNLIKLKVGSKVVIDKYSADVIGPLGTFTIDDFAYMDGNNGSKEGHWVNCRSLVLKFNFDGTTYLTAGDIETEVEDKLVAKYKDNPSMLKSDIYKLSHHGLKTSNTTKFVDVVKPTYSFEENCGHAGVAGNGYYKTYTPKSNVIKYGICYMLGEEQESLIIKIKSKKVKLYKNEVTTDTLLNNWVKLCGGDGTNRMVDKYYLEEDGTKFYKGLKTISGVKYYFDDVSGRMYVGTYKSPSATYSKKTEYSGWRTFNDGKDYRYFSESGAISTGFQKIKSVNDGKTYKYYFDPNTGIRKQGTSEKIPVNIGGSYYAIGPTGVINVNGWLYYNGLGYRWYNAEGVMAKGYTNIGGKSYYFSTVNGIAYNGLFLLNGKYYFYDKNNSNGAKVYNTWVTYSTGQKRYFDSYGVMVTGWKVIGKKKYYFNPTSGFMAVGLVTIGKNTYYFNKKGLYQKGLVYDNNAKRYRYFSTKGVMKTGWVKIKGVKYWFDKATGYRGKGITRVGKNLYYFTSNGKRKKGWVKDSDSKKYIYCTKKGKLRTGLIVLKGDFYYFDEETGLAGSGHTLVDDCYYFCNKAKKPWKSGKIFVKTWVKFENGYRYYGPSGIMYRGSQMVGGKEYKFSLKTGITKSYVPTQTTKK